MREVKVLPDAPGVFHAAAAELARIATIATAQRGRFTIALSGGSTPRSLYSLLASEYRQSIPWEKTLVFWSDERHVPPGDPQSNYRMAYEAMLSKVPVPPSDVFRVKGEDPDASAAARLYEQTIRQTFDLRAGELPRFDLILLGMGPDGHTASLFPESAGLSEMKQLVIANWIEKFKTERITFTFPVLNNGACVIFLACGPDKAEMAKLVLEGNARPPYPAQLVNPPDGRLIWMLDEGAAAGLAKS